jgi:DNA-binding protein YbaB
VNNDPVERLAELRDRADSVAQKMEAAQAQSADFTGTDESGLVSVTLAAVGHVQEVRVERGWREQLGAAGLGAAVREAAAAAATARLEAWGDAFIEQEDSPDPRPRPMPLTFETTAHQLDELATGKLDGSQRRAALEELLAMAEAIERGIDQVSGQMQAHLDAEYTGRSQGGHVTVKISGAGAIDEVRYDPRWLLEAHELNIGRETTDAFRAAYRRAGERTVADMVANSPLGEIQALGQDPLGLARRLYLRDD